jgi:acyl carrier protein
VAPSLGETPRSNRKPGGNVSASVSQLMLRVAWSRRYPEPGNGFKNPSLLSARPRPRSIASRSLKDIEIRPGRHPKSSLRWKQFAYFVQFGLLKDHVPGRQSNGESTNQMAMVGMSIAENTSRWGSHSEYNCLSMKEASVRKLDEIFRAIFKLPEDADVSNIRRNSDVPWDSLTVVMLVTAIESEFGCNIDPADALKLVSYQAARALLEEKGA